MGRRSLAAGIGLRVLAGMAVYFVLVTLWLVSSLDRVYDRIVLVVATAVVPVMTHFPLASSEGVDRLDVHNQGFVLVLVVSLALVVRGLPWQRRITHYGPLVATVLALQIVGLVLQLYLALVLKSQDSLHIDLLLPWELETVKWFARTIFLGNMQFMPFLTIVLTAFWSVGRDADGLLGGAATAPRSDSGGMKGKPMQTRDDARRLAIRRLWLVASAAGLVAVATTTTAWWVRETDERHAAAHARVGDGFAQQQMLYEAEGQYRAALRGAGGDGRVWMALATAIRGQGREEERLRVLGRALDVVTDPTWRRRLEQARFRHE